MSSTFILFFFFPPPGPVPSAKPVPLALCDALGRDHRLLALFQKNGAHDAKSLADEGPGSCKGSEIGCQMWILWLNGLAGGSCRGFI